MSPLWLVRHNNEKLVFQMMNGERETARNGSLMTRADEPLVPQPAKPLQHEEGPKQRYSGLDSKKVEKNNKRNKYAKRIRSELAKQLGTYQEHSK